MPLRYLIDEDSRGPLWKAIGSHNARGVDVLDAVRVGDPADLPLGSSDAEVLAWAAREGRILVSGDRRTMPAGLIAHLQSGRDSPGVFLRRPGASPAEVVEHLVVAAFYSEPAEWSDRIEYIP